MNQVLKSFWENLPDSDARGTTRKLVDELKQLSEDGLDYEAFLRREMVGNLALAAQALMNALKMNQIKQVESQLVVGLIQGTDITEVSDDFGLQEKANKVASHMAERWQEFVNYCDSFLEVLPENLSQFKRFFQVNQELAKIMMSEWGYLVTMAKMTEQKKEQDETK